MNNEPANGEGVAVLSDHKPQRIHQDLALVRRAVKEGWPITPKITRRILRRVNSIAATSPDDAIALKACDLIIKMFAQNQKLTPQPTQHVEHHHTHELGPVTADNFEQHRQARLARIAAGG